MISEGQCNTPGHSPTYTTADPAMVRLLEQTVAESGVGEVTLKGRYGYRLVNRKARGGVAESNRTHLWLKTHGLNVGAPDKFVPQCVFMAPETSVRLFLQALFSGDGSVYHSGEGDFPRILFKLAAPDRGRASLVAAIWGVFPNSGQDYGDRNACVARNDHR